MLAVGDCVSRFITYNDSKDSNIIYELPETWWSRQYEYIWAAQFVAPTDVVLDAACGIGHPFKFYLGTIAKEAHAFDTDPRINSKSAILEDIKATINEDSYGKFDPSLIDFVHCLQCDMTKTPYPDKMFDRVFCISVFEHVDELTQLKTLLEFSRVLKDDGIIIMTVDYPNVNMTSLNDLMVITKLKFYGESDFSIPEDAISSSYWGSELKCIRIALCKNI